MQTSISKRLLAGLLSIVMVLSLFVAVPAKTEASVTNRDLLSIVLGTATGYLTNGGEVVTNKNGLPVDMDTDAGVFDYVAAGNIMPATSGITAAILGFQPIVETITNTDGHIGATASNTYTKQVAVYKGAQKAELTYLGAEINNGKYVLDSEDAFRLIGTKNAITLVFQPLHAEDYESLKGVQVYLGDGASTANGWEAAEFMMAGGLLYVQVTTSPANRQVAPANIASLKTNIYYQYYFSNYKELKGVVDLMFTQSLLTWKYTENGSAAPAAINWTYPTYPILNSAPVGDPNKYYAVETIISAIPGFDFIMDSTKTRAENAQDYTDEMNDIIAARNTKAGLNPGDEGYDYRVFELSDISKDGKTAKLVISHIYPTVANSMIDPSITSIELSRQLNFGTNQVNNVADAKALMPKTFVATINGERKTIDVSSLLAAKKIQWTIYGVSGGSLVPLDDSTLINKSVYNENGAIVTPAEEYFAVLEWVYTLDPDTLALVPAWDPYKLVPEYGVMAPVFAGLFYAGADDKHELLKAYALDGRRKSAVTNEPVQDKGWAIQFTVNGGKSYGGMVDQPTEGLQENAAPTIMFNGFGANYTMTAYGAGTTKSFEADKAEMEAGTWNVVVNNSIACPNGDHYYMAYLEPIANVYTESPEVYTWFDPQAGLNHEAKQGAVSVTVTEPALGAIVPLTVNTIDGSMDLASADPDCPFDYPKTELYWDGEIYSANSGDNKFLDETDYTAIIAVPVKAGYALSFTPEVRFNGYVADEVEISEIDGATYLLAAYTFNKTDSDWDVEKDYCYKMLHITGLGIPYAGGVVPTELGCSESSARFYKFVDITWYENGVEFEGKAFELGKRYTAVVTYDCSAFAIKEDCQDKDILVTTDSAAKDRCIASAKITKKDAELTATFNFPAADEKLCTGVSNVDITVPYGMKTADFYAYVQTQLFPVVTFADGTTGVAGIYAILLNTGEQMSYDGDIALAFAANYPGILGYSETKKEAQNFTFTAYVYVGTQLKACKINIHVSGMKQAVNFDANGGVYAGTTALVERGMAYGFKYVPAEIYREGYFFAGWFDAPTGGNRIYAKTIFDGKVTTLYAHWVKVFTGKVWTVTAKSYAAGRLTVTAKKPATKVDGYEFSYSKDGVNWITTTQLKNVAYLTGLESKGTYFVKVRAYRIDSAGKFVYGAYSTTIKAQAK